jgi:hypothetical protein
MMGGEGFLDGKSAGVAAGRRPIMGSCGFWSRGIVVTWVYR